MNFVLSRVLVDDQRIKYYEGHLNLILQEEMDNLYKKTVSMSKVFIHKRLHKSTFLNDSDLCFINRNGQNDKKDISKNLSVDKEISVVQHY